MSAVGFLLYTSWQECSEWPCREANAGLGHSLQPNCASSGLCSTEEFPGVRWGITSYLLLGEGPNHLQ